MPGKRLAPLALRAGTLATAPLRAGDGEPAPLGNSLQTGQGTTFVLRPDIGF